MKILNLLVASIFVVVITGCQSHQARTESHASTVAGQAAPMPAGQPEAPNAFGNGGLQPTSVTQITNGSTTYTIETLPNPRLTPTSREGDKTNRVYSSNIIAVFVQTNNAVTVTSTNAAAIPASENNFPQNK